jgi:hypothetical protein
MFGNGGIKQLHPQLFECGQSTRLILSHETAVTDYVRGQYGGKSSLSALFNHYPTSPPFGRV